MRQNFVGMVVSTAMQKTVKVRVTRQKMHPIVQKMVKYHRNFLAHDGEEKCSLGDVVRIEACRPLSKLKKFTVTDVLRPAKTYTDPETGQVLR
ncbi:mitochondrial 37S ribosomal protein uS17m [Calcarisporiella thermophila]|uniref:mitochondrial 37S ribosomal protein uS17m n=1 Tax=Calcarisporiella thermophila TaxID=911321 RepID=UPI0037426A62